MRNAGVAQLVEQLICNQQVGGSSPSTSSNLSPIYQLNMGAFPSGQRGQTVNLLSTTSVVRIHPPPPLRSKLGACSVFVCPGSRLMSLELMFYCLFRIAHPPTGVNGSGQFLFISVPFFRTQMAKRRPAQAFRPRRDALSNTFFCPNTQGRHCRGSMGSPCQSTSK